MPDPFPPSSPHPDDAARRLARAKQIFLEVRAADLPAREDAIARACEGDQALRALVLDLLRGDQTVFPHEQLADQVRAARGPSDTSFALPAADAPTLASAPSADGADRIGPYKLLERLGEGGFGVVFLAEQHQPVRRRVALKIIKLGMDTRQVIARFEAERQALALMDHPNIARVLDAGATPTGRPYFVMELVRGEPITEFCDRRRLGIGERLELFAQVCLAVQHAHQKGIIHRDIKPSNVLVTTVDDKPVPKVIDFGIAKATSARLTEATVFTELRQIIGTPEYMSPEQADPSVADIDTRTDVYSLGVLLYELLTGATPFEPARLRSAAYAELQRIIREENPPRPSTRLIRSGAAPSAAALRQVEPARLRSLLRGELDWVVMRGLEKDRARRYDSAGALAADIRRYLAREPVVARPPSFFYVSRKLIARHRLAFAFSSALLLLLVAGLAGTTWGLLGQRVARKEAERRKTEAEVASQKARDFGDEALLQKIEADYGAYLANIGAALSATETGEAERARARLDACPSHLRGWEWKYAATLLDSSARVFSESQSPGAFFNSIDVAPDGQTFVAPWRMPGTQDWGACIADASTGVERVLLRGHRDWVNTARFSRDGARIVTASNDGTSRVFDVATGREVLSVRPPPGHVDSASFDAEGRRILTLTATSQIVVWDAATGAQLAAYAPRLAVYSAFFVPGMDEVLLTQGLDPPVLWNPTTNAARKAILPPVGYEPAANWAVPSADGLKIAAHFNSGEIRVFDLGSGRCDAAMRGHWAHVPTLAFSRDASLLASGSLDRTVRVWDARSGAQLRQFLGHRDWVFSVAFSPDASLVYSGAPDGSARVWRTSPEGEGLFLPSIQPFYYTRLWFSPDGRYFAASAPEGALRLFDAATHALIRDLDITRFGGIAAFRFTADSRRIVAAGDGAVGAWDVATGDRIFTLTGKPEGVSDLAISPDGSRAAVSFWNKTGNLYDTVAGKDLGLIPGFNHWTTGMAFTPDSSELVADLRTGRLSRWNARDGTQLPDSPINAARLNSLAFAPDGRALASLEDGSAMLWDATTGAVIHEFKGHGGPGRGAQFFPDGSRIVTVARDGTARLWDPATGAEVAVLRLKRPFPTCVAVSPDGTTIAVTAEQGSAQFFSTRRFPELQAR
jgi:WD40 repeat protein/serine/threonine protein kinase